VPRVLRRGRETIDLGVAAGVARVEDERREHLGMAVGHAPRDRVRRIRTLREREDDLEPRVPQPEERLEVRLEILVEAAPRDTIGNTRILSPSSITAEISSAMRIWLPDKRPPTMPTVHAFLRSFSS